MFVTKSKCPASKIYGTHMGPMWVFIWVLYGQTIWDQHGFCNRAPYGTYMGKPIWVAYGNHMGPIWVNHLFCNMDPFGTHMGKHIWDPYGSIMRNLFPTLDPYTTPMGTTWEPYGPLWAFIHIARAGEPTGCHFSLKVWKDGNRSMVILLTSVLGQ